MRTFVISLGGSILIPDKINVNFLKGFRKLILKHSKKNRFILIIGGGKICRKYQKAAKKVTKLHPEDLDWLGIHSTRLNAHLLRTIFKKIAYQRIIKDPREKVRFNKLLIGAGWQPGCSTDFDAVMLAKTYKADTVINMTNIAYLHDKNPSLYKKTRIIKQTDWKTLRKIIGSKWSPGLNVPFDPEAAKLAQKLKLKLILIGSDLKNFDNLLKGKKFNGSVVED
jgi:uridylate kinase